MASGRDQRAGAQGPGIALSSVRAKIARNTVRAIIAPGTMRDLTGNESAAIMSWPKEK
jgi:hypothetical protein